MSVSNDSRTPMMVLVVDDEAMLRFLAADALEESGFRVIEAENAREALDVLAKVPDVRVLFTDINMPGDLDGLDLAREVHEKWPDIKLVVTSGRLRLSDDEVPDAGRFVPKPYSPDALIEEIRRAVAAT